MTADQIREALTAVQGELDAGVELPALLAQLADGGSIEGPALAGLQRLAILIENNARRVRDTVQKVTAAA